jgi:hypothetical protein
MKIEKLLRQKADLLPELETSPDVPTQKRRVRFLPIYTGCALILAIGTFAMFHFLATEDPIDLNPNLPLTEAHVPVINKPRVWIENWTVSSPKVFIPHWYNPLTESEYPHKDYLPVITHYTLDTSTLEGGGWNMDYFRERNEFKISVVFDQTPQNVTYTLFDEDWDSIYISEAFSAPFEPGDYVLMINIDNDSEIYLIRLFHGGHREECNRIDTYHGGGAGLKVHNFDTLLEIRDLSDTDDATIAAYFKAICDGQKGRIWNCPCFIQTRVDLQSFLSWTRLDETRIPFSDTAELQEILLRERYGDIYVQYTIGDMLFNFNFSPESFVHGNNDEGIEGIHDNGIAQWSTERLTTIGDVNIYTHHMVDVFGDPNFSEQPEDPRVIFILSVNGVYVGLDVSIPCKNPDTCEQEYFDRGNRRNCRGEWVDRQAAIDGIMSFEFKTLFENTGAANHPQITEGEPTPDDTRPPFENLINATHFPADEAGLLDRTVIRNDGLYFSSAAPMRFFTDKTLDFFAISYGAYNRNAARPGIHLSSSVFEVFNVTPDYYIEYRPFGMQSGGAVRVVTVLESGADWADWADLRHFILTYSNETGEPVLTETDDVAVASFRLMKPAVIEEFEIPLANGAILRQSNSDVNMSVITVNVQDEETVHLGTDRLYPKFDISPDRSKVAFIEQQSQRHGSGNLKIFNTFANAFYDVGFISASTGVCWLNDEIVLYSDFHSLNAYNLADESISAIVTLPEYGKIWSINAHDGFLVLEIVVHFNDSASWINYQYNVSFEEISNAFGGDVIELDISFIES